MNQKNILDKIEEIKKGKRESCIYGAGIIGKNFGLAILKKRGIMPDFYCDSNSDLWENEVTEGIKCISIGELKKRNPVCFIMVAYAIRKEIYEFIKSLGITDIIFYDDLCEMELDSYFEFKKRKQIAVYTCISNGYDMVKEPLIDLEECDFYLISNKEPENKSIYKYIDISDIVPNDIQDFTKMNRYCKIKAHEVFPEYRYSIYLDGNLRIKNKLILDGIQRLPKTRIMTHGTNFINNIYLEAMRAGESFRDNKETIEKQVEKYWLEGMPDNFGSFLCGILIREHNNPVCKKIMNDWWEEVKIYCKKDQISLPYVLWKNGYTKEDVGILIERAEDVYNNNKYVDVENHSKPYPRGKSNET